MSTFYKYLISIFQLLLFRSAGIEKNFRYGRGLNFLLTFLITFSVIGITFLLILIGVLEGGMFGIDSIIIYGIQYLYLLITSFVIIIINNKSYRLVFSCLNILSIFLLFLNILYYNAYNWNLHPVLDISTLIVFLLFLFYYHFLLAWIIFQGKKVNEAYLQANMEIVNPLKQEFSTNFLISSMQPDQINNIVIRNIVTYFLHILNHLKSTFNGLNKNVKYKNVKYFFVFYVIQLVIALYLLFDNMNFKGGLSKPFDLINFLKAVIIFSFSIYFIIINSIIAMVFVLLIRKTAKIENKKRKIILRVLLFSVSFVVLYGFLYLIALLMYASGD